MLCLTSKAPSLPTRRKTSLGVAPGGELGVWLPPSGSEWAPSLQVGAGVHVGAFLND